MTADRIILAVVLALLVAGLFLLMARSWKRRSTRDHQLHGYELPAVPVPEQIAVRVTYVATTQHDLPLERMQPKGLAFRAQGTLAVASDGVTIDLAGSEPFFIPAAAMRDVKEATWVIDRAVENRGLVCVSWLLRTSATDATAVAAMPPSGVIADSYFRVIDAARRADVITTLSTLLPVAPTTGANSEANE